MQLGLKEYFKGKPDHILIRENEIYNKTSNRKEKYLVFYETIPGGTGYLSKLFDTEIFTEILKKAYERIAFCSCKQEGKDGCYRCIYTYGNQYERNTLSRSEAEELFSNILEKTDEWNSIESLENVSSFANNEESDLELKFVGFLEALAKRYKGSSFKQGNEKGLKKYRLKLVYNTDEIIYEVWPQNLGVTLSGISYKTRPDFVLRCVRLSKGGRDWTINELEALKSIAIYLDGYEYHASENHPRFPSDLAIRNSIIDSERYYQWTFTWTDFSENIINEKDFIGLIQDENFIKNKILSKHPVFKGCDISNSFFSNNTSRFFHLMINPLTNYDLNKWSSLILFNCQTKLLGRCFSEEQVLQISDSKTTNNFEPLPSNASAYAQADRIKLVSEAELTVFIRAKDFEVKGFGQFENNGSWDKSNWIQFWKVYNLTQFHHIKVELAGSIKKIPMDKKEGVDSEILLNFSEELHPIVTLFIDNNIEFNTKFDFDLVEEDIIIASAELGSHDNKIVVNPFDEESEIIFKDKGYKIYNPNNFKLE